MLQDGISTSDLYITIFDCYQQAVHETVTMQHQPIPQGWMVLGLPTGIWTIPTVCAEPRQAARKLFAALQHAAAR